jgi:hypothetical protein
VALLIGYTAQQVAFAQKAQNADLTESEEDVGAEKP